MERWQASAVAISQGTGREEQLIFPSVLMVKIDVELNDALTAHLVVQKCSSVGTKWIFTNILISSLFRLITARLKIQEQQMGVGVLPQPVGPLNSWLSAGHFLGDLRKGFRPNIFPVNSQDYFFRAVLWFWKRWNAFKSQHLHTLVAFIYSYRSGWRSGLWVELRRSHCHTETLKLTWSAPVFPLRCSGYIPERGNNTYTWRWNTVWHKQKLEKAARCSQHIVTYSSSWWLDFYETKTWRKSQFLLSIWTKVFLKKKKKKAYSLTRHSASCMEYEHR